MKKPNNSAKTTLTETSCFLLALRMLLRMPSGAAVLAAELALDMIVLGFRTALITGWRYD